MILLIDNYDSFSYNLVQLAGSICTDIQVIRNDAMTVEEIKSMHPDHIILSPGPGYPKTAGVCEEVVRELMDYIPILGVCLGHQGICEVMGASIIPAKKLMHGKQSKIYLDKGCRLFQGLGETMEAARYHSLIADRATLPNYLIVTGEDSDGEVMAVRHKDYPLYGVQFHPESILTPKGRIIMKNFLEMGENNDKRSN